MACQHLRLGNSEVHYVEFPGLGMHDLDRIEHALATKLLSEKIFERCAQDLLSGLYDGLSPIPGGSDWGRDADIPGAGDDIPARVLITSSRSLDGVRKNMLTGIRSMKDHDVPVSRIVLANPAILRLGAREKLVRSAERAGALLNVSEIFDGGFFASRLRRDGYWRAALLGLPSSPVTLSPVAPGLAESPWAFLPLVARAEDLASVAEAGDLILTGTPSGTGAESGTFLKAGDAVKLWIENIGEFENKMA